MQYSYKEVKHDLFTSLSEVICTYMNVRYFFRYEKPVKGRKINWMKAGILESTKVLTVSPYYASELVSGVDKGVELDNILRKTCVTGIVNGMDTQEWNPATDKHIDVNYDITTVRSFTFFYYLPY